jgi:peptide/nickel transport system substrate-binding protein
VFNTMSYQSPAMDKLIDGARGAAAVGDTAAYENDVRGFVDLAFADVPRIPLYQPYVNVAMQKNVSGRAIAFEAGPHSSASQSAPSRPLSVGKED